MVTHVKSNGTWVFKICVAEAKVYSAGLKKHGLNLDAVKVMGLAGVDISDHTSNLVRTI